jgi:hypothetical protein
MGNHPSRPESSAFQPDDTSHISTSRRASRLTSRVSLRQRAGPYELEGDPNVTRTYELEGDPVQPEMVANPRSVGQLAITATYLQAEDTRLPRLGPVELSAQSSTTTGQPQLAPTAVRGPQIASTTVRQTQRTPTTTRNSQRTSAAARRPQKSRPVNSTQPAPVQQQVPQLNKDPAHKAQLSRNIASISHLLREMYSLDLKIFGTQNERSQDQAERNRMIDQADLLFQKIKTTLDGWDAQSEWWTDDERRVLRSILSTAEHHAPKRNRTRRA